jgi:ribosomal protein L27
VQYDKHQDTKFSKGERLGVSSIEGFAVESGDIPNDKNDYTYVIIK